MITSEELESCDIFPKKFSFSCLFKFLLYSFSSILAFIILIDFYLYSNFEFPSMIKIKHLLNDENIYINDYLTNKLVELNPKDFLSENKTNFKQKYDNLRNIFFKEYVIKSYPCLIMDSVDYFGVREIIDKVEKNLINDKDEIIFFEYRDNPYSQFYDEDYKYIRTTYYNYLNLTKNAFPNYYFLNQYNIEQNNNSIYDIIYDKYLQYNYLVNDLDLNNIYLSSAENYVVVWGHMGRQDEFICLNEGYLEFVLIPPQEKKNIYPFSKNGPINYSRANFFDDKKNEKFPDFVKANKLFISLLPGECLYIPAFWWRSYRTHETKKIKTTFLSFKYKTNSNYLDQLMYVQNDF